MGSNHDPATVRLLRDAAEGHGEALNELVPLVYDELRAIARRQLSRERPDHTLDSVALVNETYMKLVGHADVSWENRAHFYAIAARAMRSILVDHARARNAAKRGGGAAPVTLQRVPGLSLPERSDYLLDLDEALGRLEQVSPEASRTVEYRYFAGLTLEEIAAALDVSFSTVRRRWAFAKAWLRRELGEAR